MPTTFGVIFLGVSAIDIDPTEGNVSSENQNALLGTTFGGASAPLYNNVQTLSPVGSPGISYDSNNNPDQFSVDGVTYTMDGWGVYNATVTYSDGTSATVEVKLAQTTTGRLYLTPHISGEAALQAVLEAKPIMALTLVSPGPPGTGMTADRLAGEFKQPVDGTAAGDTIGVGYADAGGAAVTAGADVINGGGGNDSITAGDGGDLVFGDSGNDTLDGGLGADTVSGGDGDDRLRLTELPSAPNWSSMPNTVGASPVTVNTTTTGDQSPPKVVLLDDGRVLYIWSNAATSDDVTTMTLQGRIYDANGQPATSQFTLTSWPIDGNNGMDVDALDVKLLPNGNVAIGYVRNSATTGFTSQDEPVLTIINPDIAPNTTGFYVAQNVELQQNDTTTQESPPILTVLDDGRILAVWSKNGLSDDIASMTLNGRIFDQNGANPTAEFQIGTWAVDGHDSYDMPAVTVSQLTGGNVVVGYVRSTGVPGADEPVFSVINPAVAPGSAGFAVVTNVEAQQTDTTSFESPPVITALDDGRFMAVWLKNGEGDGSAMTIQGRIFNANGSAASNEFRVGNMRGDGSDGYDTDNLTITRLTDGNVVIGYVNSGFDGMENPHFSILNPDLAPGAAGFEVMANARINALLTPNSLNCGPPSIMALEDGSGRFVASWVDGASTSGGNAVKFRIFASDGTPVSTEVTVQTAGNDGITTNDNFDWENLQITSLGGDDFVITWASFNDGSGSGVRSSGPISADSFTNGSAENLIGGEGGESTGDVLDASAITSGMNVTYTANEAGQITTDSTTGTVVDGIIDTAGARYEVFVLDRAAFTDPGAFLRASTSSGATTSGTITLNGYTGARIAVTADRIADSGGGTLVGGVTLNGTSYAAGSTVEMDYGFVVQDTAGIEYFIGKVDIGGNANGFDGSIITAGWNPVTGTWVGPPAPGTTFTLVSRSGAPWGGGGTSIARGTLTPYSNDVEIGLGMPALAVEFPTSEQTASFSEVEQVILGSGNDTVDGSATTGGINIDTGLGNDTILGGAGQDSIVAGGGNDTVDAGNGNDQIFGGDGNDSLLGGAQSDTLYGGTGADTLLGGDQDDELYFGAADSAEGGSGDDQFFLLATEGTGGNATVRGGETGEDLTDFSGGGIGDLLDVSGAGVGGAAVNTTITFTGTEQGTVTGTPTTVSFSEIELFATGAGNDTINASAGAGNQTFYVNDGNDSVIGGSGNDTVLAGQGHDQAFGGAGDDWLWGQEGNDTLEGGAGNDRFAGGLGDDSITDSGGGNENIWGDEGNDTIGAGAGADVVYGGDGNDSILAGDGVDTIYGDAGNDQISGQAGTDELFGGAGSDTIFGGSEADTMQGGDGDDRIAIGNGDVAFGGAGDDQFVLLASEGSGGSATITGGESGEDTTDPTNGSTGDLLDVSNAGVGGAAVNTTITFSATEQGTVTGTPTTVSFSEIELFASGAGNDTINASASTGNQTFWTNAGNDSVIGGAGDDTVLAGQGDDSVLGGAGADWLWGEAGEDTLDGAAGNDVFSGGAGNDVILAGDGVDTVYGDAGNDQISGQAGADELFGGTGSDTIFGGSEADTMYGDDGDDRIAIGNGDVAFGGAGDDLFVLQASEGSGGSATITGGESGEDLTDPANGGSGDILDVSQAGGANLTVTLTGTEQGSITGASTLINFAEIEQIVTGTGNDTINASASAGNIILQTGAGNDSIIGGSGNDTLLGGAGADTLQGGAGADSVAGEAGDDDIIVGGADTATGGTGDDVFTVDTSDPNLAAQVFGGSDGTDGAPDDAANGNAGDLLDLSSGTTAQTVNYDTNPENGTVNGLDGDAGVDLTFADIEQILTGSAGDSILGTGALTSIIIGTGAGNDTITTGAGNDLIDAGADNDVINANAGNDSVTAGAGDDTVDGGAGNDTLDGGSGNDSVLGQAGADLLLGGDGNDTLDGGADNDTLSGGLNDDSMLGGDGNDALSGGDGNDTLLGGAGNDLLQGDAGNDTLTGNAGNDTLEGGSGNDSLLAGDGADSAMGGDGDDIINTRAAAASPDAGFPGFGSIPFFPMDSNPNDDRDTVDGGAGNDTILTGDDADLVFGGTGNDSIDAGVDNDTVFGGLGNDTLIGGEGRDSIEGGDGDDLIDGGDPAQPGADIADTSGDPLTTNNIDTLRGGDGNDTIFGGDDNDVLFGDAGNDLLDGGVDDDSLVGGDGNDTLLGGNGNDTIFGDAGNDTIEDGAGNDLVYAGSENDVSNLGAGNDTIFMDDGNDTINVFDSAGQNVLSGGSGTDRLDFQNAAATTGATVIFTGNGAGTFSHFAGATTGTFTEFETVAGTTNNDALNAAAATTGVTLDGEAGDDTISGGAGADSISGGAGSDDVLAGNGNDTVSGGDGADTIRGEAGDDLLSGEIGDDSLIGGAGNDSLFGGVGNDSLSDGAGNDVVYAGAGDDLVQLSDGNDTIFMDDGNDTVNVWDDDGQNVVAGGAGTDRLDFLNFKSSGGATVTFTGNGAGTFSHYSGATTGTFTEFEIISGTANNDILNAAATTTAVTIDGEAGNDVITGGSAADTLIGGDGNDTINGGAGNDSLTGGNGDDVVDGGAGDDRLDGLAGNDSLSGGSGSDTVQGDDGDDSLSGGAGNDSLVGGAGQDTLQGGAGNDTLTAGDGNDYLDGGGGNNILDGGAGNDTLQIGFGSDILTTGDGEDVIIFSTDGDGARVTDFDTNRINGRAVDQIDVSALTTTTGAPIKWRDVTVTDTIGDGTGDAILTFPNLESIILEGVTRAEVEGPLNLIAIGIPCFVSGTPILTPKGWMAVENLAPGDSVITTEGVQRVIWAGQRMLSAVEFARHPEWKPVHFPTGAIGNTKPLRLSPQHAVLMRDRSGAEILVRAKHLAEIGFAGARVAQGVRAVRYHHILVERHAVLCAAGAAAESFYPGRLALEMLDWPSRLSVSAAIGGKIGLGQLTSSEDLVARYGARIHPLAPRKALLGLAVAEFWESAGQTVCLQAG